MVIVFAKSIGTYSEANKKIEKGKAWYIMSFSRKVKEELSQHLPTARHCQIAELAALISMCGRICINERNEYYIKIHTENLTVANKYFNLVKAAFLTICEVKVSHHIFSQKTEVISGKGCMYELVVKDAKMSKRILEAVKLLDIEGNIEEELSPARNLVIQNLCCKRAFLRGIFLAGGSITNPEKSYHLELVTQALPKAEQLCEIIKIFHMEARMIKRKKTYVVYLKDSTQIADFLKVCEASCAVFDLENIRIKKEIRNTINRQVNCETANIEKTIRASVRQVDDICLIRDKRGLGSLSKNLTEIAQLRLEYPDASLKELGDMADPPIGKSGVNHRLRKISEIAQQMRSG